MDNNDLNQLIAQARELVANEAETKRMDESPDFNEGFIVRQAEAIVELADRLGL